MEKIIPLLISAVAGLSTVFGCIFIYIKPKNAKNFIGAALAFSATVMILLSITELIPKGFINLEYRFNLMSAFIALFLMLLIGNLLSIMIKRRIDKHKDIDSNLYKLGILSMVALMMHNLPEGILTYISSVIDIELGIKLGAAIMLHNIPEGVAIAVPIYYATKSRKKAFKATLISGLSEPLGAIIAWLFLGRFMNEVFISIMLLFVAGLMISISINDIFQETKKYHKKHVILGAGLATLLFIIHTVFLH